MAQNHEMSVYFSTFMSRTAKPAKFEMCWFPNEGRYSALKIQADINLAFPSPDEGKASSDSLVLGLRNW